jgi:urea transport system substrate-binding protein
MVLLPKEFAMPALPLSRRRFFQAALSGCGATAVAGAVPFTGVGGTIKVGILHSLTGTMAISETALKDVELLAIEEINANGGVLGRQIEPIIEDPQSKFTDLFPLKAKKLLEQDNVAVLFGWWTSVSRKNVLPVLEQNNGLLFYPIAYEGNECSKNVVYTGSLQNQQIAPAVDYLWEKLGKRKFYFFGSDYIYPRVAHLLMTNHLKEKYKTQPIGEKFVPLGQQEFQNVVDDIKKANPDVILNNVNGDSNINLFGELRARGFDPATVPVCSFTINEDELRGLDPDKMKGNLAAWSYFQSIDTPANKQFVQKLKDKYGKDRVAFDEVEAAYTAVYLWKQAVEKAKSADVDKVLAAIRGLEIDGPGGKFKIDEKNQHAWKRCRIGKIREDRQFDIVHETPPLRPEPYPALLKLNRDCDWTKGGAIRRDN